MPTYEYKCNACGKTFEKFQSITAAPVRKCPLCGRRAVRRLISAGGAVIFKGSGFYQTDYRSDSYKKAAEKEKPTSPKASNGDKPAAKPKPAPDKGKTKDS
ncbi:MAG: zinc ribbon domain-containing protein [Planctomycetota bacterium]|nr:zinc ribbon domain-containing protein [Planctomycetota bacterium]